MGMIKFFVDKSNFVVPLIFLGGIVWSISGKSKWQYYPLYFLALVYIILVLLSYFKIFEVSESNTKWILGMVIGLLFITIASLLAFPKENLPNPSGQFKIGTRTFEVVDLDRDEIYTEIENDKRKIKYQIWYPTDDTTGLKKVKWMMDGLALSRQLAKSMHLAAFMLDQTVEIDSNSYADAMISKALKNYPVVLISHGWRGFRELHTDFAEELASHGFIAVSIDHTYGAQAVKFEEGGVALLNEKALPRFSKSTQFDAAAPVLIATYGRDVSTVLDDLEKQARSNTDFKGKLNLQAIGVLGHSAGGGGDVYIALRDKRIKALMGLDSWVNPIKSEELQEGLSIPGLFLRSEQWSMGPNNIALKKLISNSKQVTLIQMNETKHIDFSMAYMYSPLAKYIGFTGKLGGRKSSAIQKELMVEFFDFNLRSQNEHTTNYLQEIADKYENLKLIDLN